MAHERRTNSEEILDALEVGAWTRLEGLRTFCRDPLYRPWFERELDLLAEIARVRSQQARRGKARRARRTRRGRTGSV